ncbi:hypothetical protein QFC19_006480 [Naganishia cerealis]|uniref:Uncharacterized protein n=1 Tax=Naganishia cerealis TaxID=610337 RepID=A0ACC2VG20_9TREE|nr:hypothetical protein QFC19_006480 [Naganishia cerealis]
MDNQAAIIHRRPSLEPGTCSVTFTQEPASCSSPDTQTVEQFPSYHLSPSLSAKSHDEASSVGHDHSTDGPPLEEAAEGEGWESVTYTEKEDRTVARKIDRVLLPLLMSAYCLQYVDKSAMSYAAVFHFRQDNKLSANQYQWLGSCYYLGYLVFEFPGR